MVITYSDEDIQVLLTESKSPLAGTRSQSAPVTKGQHRELSFDFISESSTHFHVILRRHSTKSSDFSAILAVEPAGIRTLFRLRRYNGSSHRHSNRIEGDRITGFHIHMATQRYQERGMKEDGFAIPTDRYNDLAGAVACLSDDAHVHIPSTWLHPLSWL